MSTGYSPEEMRRFWREHSRVWRDLDRTKDPEGLSNVCFAGAPLWLNRFASWCQIRAFRTLLEEVGSLSGRKVLDVGCGVARWTRLMSGLGAAVTGIDLQSETLRDNKSRLPSCRFVEMSADSLAFGAGSFSLATSVTVLQHLPDEIQDAAISEIRRVLGPGNFFLLLEGTKDRGAAVFSHSAEGWRAKAEAAGFRLRRMEPFDFAPLVYGLKSVASAIRSREGGAAKPAAVERYASSFREAAEERGLARRVYRMMLHAATTASYPLEPALVRAAPGGWAHHMGFLFEAV